MVPKSAVCKQDSLFRRNQAEHRVQALALCTAQSSHSQMLGICPTAGLWLNRNGGPALE